MSYPAFVVVTLAVAALTAAGVLNARSRTHAVAAALVGAMALLLLSGLGFFRFLSDDAFITFRYSDHLASGLGPNWNSEGRVEGYTNFSWMLLLAGFAKLGADLVVVAQVLGALAMAGTLYVVYLLWRRWAEEDPEAGIASPAVVAAALFAIALAGATAFWGFSGMETPLFTFLLTLGAYLFLEEQRRGSLAPWSAVALAATAMTRPEGLIAVAVTGVFVLVRAVDTERGVIDLRRPLLWGGAFALLYVSYFAWRFAYYDHLLPNTFYAKVDVNRAVLDRGLEYVWTYGMRYLLVPMVIGGAIALTRPKLRLDAAYILALCGAMLAGVVVEGGEHFAHGRLVAPVLPLLYVAGLAGLAMALHRLALPERQQALIALATLTLAALTLLRASQLDLPPLARERDAIQERETLARWIAGNTPEDYTVAAFAVGVIGYESERDILDMLGLNDVTIAHTDVPRVGTGIAGHEKYNIDYVLDVVRPEIIIIADAEPRPIAEDDLRAFLSGRTPVPARDRLFADERLWERYDVVSIQLDGHWYNFLQRADTLP